MSLYDLVKSKSKKSTRQFIGAASVEDCCLTVSSGDRLALLILAPVNLSILAPEDVRTKIKHFNAVLSALGTSDYICVNSTQSYESNKHFLAGLAEEERSETLLELDRLDMDYLDEIRVKMATSRLFLVLLRFPAKDSMDNIEEALTKALQLMKDNEFSTRLAYRDNLKQLLAVYFSQAIFQDRFPDYDGEAAAQYMEGIG